jgi:pimeloyl-ACP methyl ester carboxylesterase
MWVFGRLPKPVKIGALSLVVLVICFVAWALHVDPAADAGTPFSEPPNSRPDVIVVLIHGTFAPDARWMAPTSPLVRAIGNALHPQAVLFQPFVWSGLLGTRYNNTNMLRSAAGEKLGKLLVVLRSRWPSAKIVLVAHSHGGNVALYAANRYGDVARLSGIVCMGTPFIAVTPKAIDDDPPMLLTMKIVGEFLFFAVVIASLVLGVGCMGLAFRIGGAGRGIVRVVTIPIGIVVGLFSYGLMKWPVSVDKDRPFRLEHVAATDTQPAHDETRENYVESEAAKRLEAGIKTWLINGSLTFAKHHQATLVAQMSAITPASVPVFCLRSDKDEAYRSLHLEDSISVCITAFLSSSTVSGLVVGIGGFIVLCVALFVGGRTAIEFLRDEGFGFGRLLGALFMGGMMGWMTALLTSLAFGALLIVLALLSVIARAPAAAPALLAYGSLNVLSEYLIDIQSRREPVDWTARQIKGSQVKSYVFPATLGGFEHSKYYLDPDSVSDVTTWVKERVGPRY